MKIVQPRELIELAQQSENKKEKIQELMLKIQKNLNLDHLNTAHMNVSEFQLKIMLASLFTKSGGVKRNFKSQYNNLNKIKEEKKSLNAIKSKIHRLSKKKRNKIESLFVTFESIAHREIFKDLLRRRRIFGIVVHQQREHEDMLRVAGRRVYAVEPPEPINILWKNYSYTKRNKLKRRVFSWSVYILLYLFRKKIPFLYFLNFLALLILNYFSSLKNEISLKKPICPPRIAREVEVSEGFKIPDKAALSQIECFCFSHREKLTPEYTSTLHRSYFNP